jgi:putative NADH-flavin reductase
MKIGIIGAIGNAGRAIYAEAISRGHDVTALVRDPDRARELLGPKVVVVAKDAFDLVAGGRTWQTGFSAISRPAIKHNGGSISNNAH